MRSSSQVLGGAPPPGVALGEGGGGGWAWLTTAQGVVEARLIGGLLEQAGIVPVHLDATDPSPTSWLFLSGDVNALVRIYVPVAQLDPARLVLLEQEVEAPEPSVTVPPSTWSPRRVLLVLVAAVVVVVFAWRLLHSTCALC